MKKKFFDAIRTGRKRTTLRYWRRRMARPGSLHTIPGLGKVFIESVEVVKLKDLTASDARADGFKSLRELRRALQEMYSPEQRKERTLFLVHFKFPPPPEHPGISAASDESS